MINVADVLSRLASGGLLVTPPPRTEIAITGIADDSREVRKGYLFCAIRGHRQDGHSFLEEVKQAGAAAALVEERRSVIDLPQFRVTDGRRAASVAAHVVYGDPAAALRLVGVTGTNGKTTTVHIARHLLAGELAVGSIGTLGVVLPAGGRREGRLTTPGPIEFAAILAEMRDAGGDCVVSEVSSHALRQRRVDGASFDVAVFTNLSRDHLDYHESVEEYRDSKLRLIELVADGGTVILIADDPAWSGVGGERRTVRYGASADADYRVEGIELTPAGSRWTLEGAPGSFDVELPLLGEFNVYNALAAAAAAHSLGIGMHEIVASLKEVPAVPGRLEVLSREPLILRDYAHTPDALRRALQALRATVVGRLIVVFGCGGDRDRGKRPLMGRVAAEGADLAIVTSDNPRNEAPEAIIDEIIPGVGAAPHERTVDRRTAIARAIELADEGDAVLLAGKGHETYQVVGAERRPFDEAVIVRELLEGRGAGPR